MENTYDCAIRIDCQTWTLYRYTTRQVTVFEWILETFIHIFKTLVHSGIETCDCRTNWWEILIQERYVSRGDSWRLMLPSHAVGIIVNMSFLVGICTWMASQVMFTTGKHTVAVLEVLVFSQHLSLIYIYKHK